MRTHTELTGGVAGVETSSLPSIERHFMHRIAGGILICTLTLSVAAAQDKSADKPDTPAERYKALLKEFNAAAHANWQATTDEERKQIVARIENLPLRILELVEEHPRDPIALDALTQVVTQEYWLDNYSQHPGWGKESRQARAIAMLLRDHIQSDKLDEACRRVHLGFRQECETFLRTVLEKSLHREVRAAACLRLAQFLKSRWLRLDLLQDQPEMIRRYEGLYGKDYLDALRRQDHKQVVAEAEAIFEQAIEKYGDVKIPFGGGTVGETARAELYVIRNLSVGKVVPEIEGEDQDGTRFKLSDYRGTVVLLYFWAQF